MAEAAVVCGNCGVAVRSVTDRKTLAIGCTGAYHLSRREARLNVLELAASVTAERRRRRSLEHVAHLTASHGVWREGCAGSDAFRSPHAPVWLTRLSRGARARAGTGRPRDGQLWPAGRGDRQGAGDGSPIRPGATLAAGRRQGQGLLADDLQRRLE